MILFNNIAYKFKTVPWKYVC